MGHLVATFLGSYQLTLNVLSYDETMGEAIVEFIVENTSTLASATRPPIVGYWLFWRRTVAPFVNGLAGADGPLSEKKQKFRWTEKWYLPGQNRHGRCEDNQCSGMDPGKKE